MSFQVALAALAVGTVNAVNNGLARTPQMGWVSNQFSGVELHC